MLMIPRDVQEFLDGYPGVDDDPITCRENFEFYSNNTRCIPDNLTIQEIHERWLGDYSRLEYKHGYIQWLFPIREYGMNFNSQPLQTHEIESMKADPIILERVVRSYQLMLDFYGMHLVSEETGLVDRALPPRYFAPRYRNLVRSSHNYLRISRILKCLSEMGLEYLSAGFLLHVLNEQSESHELNSRGLCNSMDRWWANCIRNEEERLWIRDLIQKVRFAEDGYVFTRQDYEKALQNRTKTERLAIQKGAQEVSGEEIETEVVQHSKDNDSP